MTVTTPPAPPLPDELQALLRRLRLPYLRRAAPEVIATAASQRWEHTEVLRVLLAEEAAGRDQATIQMRRRASGLPAGKTFDAWEPGASAIPLQTQNAPRTLEWIDRAEVLVACGPSGTGKSHCETPGSCRPGRLRGWRRRWRTCPERVTDPGRRWSGVLALEVSVRDRRRRPGCRTAGLIRSLSAPVGA
jgi:IstB-like ATP binding protein